MSERVTIIFGRVDAVTAELRSAVCALESKALTEFFHEIDIWAETVSDGRSPLRTMNHRFEIFRLEASPPSPWIVGAFDTSTREFVVCALLPDRRAPSIEHSAALCARALGVSVESLA
jgi:hypothetical protein